MKPKENQKTRLCEAHRRQYARTPGTSQLPAMVQMIAMNLPQKAGSQYTNRLKNQKAKESWASSQAVKRPLEESEEAGDTNPTNPTNPKRQAPEVPEAPEVQAVPEVQEAPSVLVTPAAQLVQIAAPEARVTPSSSPVEPLQLISDPRPIMHLRIAVPVELVWPLYDNSKLSRDPAVVTLQYAKCLSWYGAWFNDFIKGTPVDGPTALMYVFTVDITSVLHSVIQTPSIISMAHESVVPFTVSKVSSLRCVLSLLTPKLELVRKLMETPKPKPARISLVIEAIARILAEAITPESGDQYLSI